MNLRDGFSRFFESRSDRLHFAAHSHHPWPDVSYSAHVTAWEDAARLADDKWAHIFGEVIPATQRAIATTLNLEDPANIAFAPNTHDFVTRLFSCVEPPVRVLTTDSEFHSFNRQSRRWEEEGLAIVDRIRAQPFSDFADRFTRQVRAGAHDLIYLSQVFFDSGFIVPDLDRIVSSSPDDRAFLVIDGYHGFMALPTDLGAIQDRIFYLAGGYKYAMAGEGVCFMHCPAGYAPRPVDTGWYAGFGQLESGVSERVPYSEDGSRFAGATYDPSGVYRMRAVLEWLGAEDVNPKSIHEHAVRLQQVLVDNIDLPGEIVVDDQTRRGNFLTLHTDRAGILYDALHERGVITDFRGDRLRFGFGVYHTDDDVEALIQILGQVV